MSYKNTRTSTFRFLYGSVWCSMPGIIALGLRFVPFVWVRIIKIMLTQKYDEQRKRHVRFAKSILLLNGFLLLISFFIWLRIRTNKLTKENQVNEAVFNCACGHEIRLMETEAEEFSLSLHNPSIEPKYFGIDCNSCQQTSKITFRQKSRRLVHEGEIPF